MFADRTITCSECKTEFNFTSGEQQFYEERGFSSPPRRCKECRKSRRDTPGGGSSAGGGGDRPPRRHEGGPGAAGAERVSHPASCSACGAETTVPFKPDPARATFCKPCYAERRGPKRQ